MRPNHRTCRGTFTFLFFSLSPSSPTSLLHVPLAASVLCDDGESVSPFTHSTLPLFVVSCLSFFCFGRLVLLLLLPWSSCHLTRPPLQLACPISPPYETYRLTPVWCAQVWPCHLQSYSCARQDLVLDFSSDDPVELCLSCSHCFRVLVQTNTA